MISEVELMAEVERLEGDALRRWIARGWIRPGRSERGYLFDEADVARARLLRDLCYEMEYADEDLSVVLALMDQLHGARRLLRVLGAALDEQSEEVRGVVLTRVRALLNFKD